MDVRPIPIDTMVMNPSAAKSVASQHTIQHSIKQESATTEDLIPQLNNNATSFLNLVKGSCTDTSATDYGQIKGILHGSDLSREFRVLKWIVNDNFGPLESQFLGS